MICNPPSLTYYWRHSTNYRANSSTRKPWKTSKPLTQTVTVCRQEERATNIMPGERREACIWCGCGSVSDAGANESRERVRTCRRRGNKYMYCKDTPPQQFALTKSPIHQKSLWLVTATSLVARTFFPTLRTQLHFSNYFRRLGALGVTLGTPFLTYALYFTCNEAGCPSPEFLANPVDTFKTSLWPGWSGIFSAQATGYYVAYFFALIAMQYVLPGKTAEGVVLTNGTRLKYKLNGVFVSSR